MARGVPRWARAVLAEWLLVLALVAVSAGVLSHHADDQRFSIDESRWIATSRYFWITFLDRDVFGPAWQPNYIILTHPPVARYIIGFGLWLQGWTPEQLNGRYDTDRSRDWNRERGNIPESDLLDAARRVVLVFAVGATVLLYLIGRLLGGPLTGVLTVMLALGNPLLATLWTRALAEAVLAFFSLLAFLLAFLLALLVARAGRERPRYAVALALGAALGLAAATKLTGVFVGLGVGLFAASQRAMFWRNGRRWPGVGVWLDALLAAILVFILANPLLYPNPVSRTLMLFEHRRDEMRQQALGTPRLAVPPELGARADLMYRRTFEEYGTVQEHLGLPLDAPLAATGVAAAAVLAWRAWRSSGLAHPWLLLLSWTAATYLVSTVNLGFNSSHYFALPVLLAVQLQGMALAALAGGGWRLIRRRVRPATA